MHILIIPSERYLPDDSPLSGIFQRHQAKALVRHGYQVGIVSPDLFTSRFSEMLKIRVSERNARDFTYLDEEIPVHKKKIWVWERFISNYSRVWIKTGLGIFEKYINCHGIPDVIHAHNAIIAGLLAQSIYQKYNIPYVITEHSSVFALGNLDDQELNDVKTAYSHSKALIAVSPSLCELLEGKFHQLRQTWQWVPNLIDPEFESGLPKTYRKKELVGELKLLAIASLDRNKGIDTLLGALANFVHTSSKVRLTIVGSGPEKENLKQLAKQLNIMEIISFKGYLDRRQVKDEILKCDCLVHPSRYETFGVVLIETLMHGKPVISTACGGPECIVNDRNGILVPIDNADALAGAIQGMAENINRFDPALIQKDCLDRFGSKPVVNALRSIYCVAMGLNPT
ncbi:glycosyltransferase [Nodosilinea sp. LEGE 06152]|uniref:glycosyltransferase n=1 Tax=Nodosilinea sp. LEGE 06152 TaxID=2777966 RepID=UPI001881031A|nr:glycosyltransferase [Nodosilinea sp. LEGE 06152]MBE9157910.1 glycosyltransferase [Nodosilinea sp. LEGE 06152]